MKKKKNRCSWSIAMLAAFLLFLGGFAATRNDSPRASSLEPIRGNVQAAPKNLAELLVTSSAEIGLMNLLCAEGLQGSEQPDTSEHLKRLDGIASRVRSETQRHYYRFREHPEQFEHSEGYFQMLMMAVVLQEDLRIEYNPDRITPVGVFESNEAFFADSRDVFIHGLIADRRRMGTCASLPVLYVAIGRRLGYPLKLVPAKNHLFVRWESTRERFNVDATGRGMNRHEDDHYRHWPLPITPEEEQEFGYLKSMTATDELTAFLALRAECLFAMGKTKEGLEAHETALCISPGSRHQQVILAKARERVAAKSPVAWLPPEARDDYWNRPTSVQGPRIQILR